MMKLPLEEPARCFVRVVGANGKVRELRAVLDTASTCSVLPTKDALQLGYQISYDPYTGIGEGSVVVTVDGIIYTSIAILKEVWLGDLVVKDLKALIYDFPEQAGVDVILGTNFLKNFKLTFDYEEGTLSIEQVKGVSVSK